MKLYFPAHAVSRPIPHYVTWLLLTLLLLFAPRLAAEDVVELLDGRVMQGTVVEQSDSQVRLEMTMGKSTAVVGVPIERIKRMVIKGEEQVLVEQADIEPKEEDVKAAEPEEVKAEPPPLPVPLGGPTRVWQRLQEGKAQHIVVYGTSMVSDRYTGIPSSLRAALKLAAPVDSKLVTVTGRTNAGEYSKWGLDSLQGQVLSLRPDAVIIEFASNDSVSRFNLSVDQARQNWLKIIAQIRSELPETDIFLYISNPPWDRESSGRRAGASNRPNITAYFDMLRELSIIHQTYLIDTWYDFSAQLDPPKFKNYRGFVGDGRHPGKRGVDQITIPMILQVLEHGSADQLGAPGMQHLTPELQKRAAAISEKLKKE